MAFTHRLRKPVASHSALARHNWTLAVAVCLALGVAVVALLMLMMG